MLKYSIIIIAKKENELNNALIALKNLKYPDNEYEIIKSIGNNPSKQRNMAAKEASGQYLVFLDNDSIVDPHLLEQYDSTFLLAKDASVIGGPSCYENNDPFQNAVNKVMSCYFGTGPTNTRYQKSGKLREASEKMLIGANLLIERKEFEKVNGFDEELYPNEENELIKRINDNIWYNPNCVIYRKHRATFFDFAKQIFCYGNGRMKHIKKKPGLDNLVFFIPAIFTLYVFTLIFRPDTIIAPMYLYIALLFMITFKDILRKVSIRESFLILILYPICHFSYGLGFLTGAVYHPSKSKKHDLKVNIVNT